MYRELPDPFSKRFAKCFKTIMEECGKIAESLGHAWGGRWTSPQDTPHVTVKMGCTLAEARQRVAEGKWGT